MKVCAAMCALLSIVLLLPIIHAYGDNGPLYVIFEERYNITGTINATSVSVEIKNITGYIIINNTGEDINDALYDVWIAVNISNNISGLRVIYNPTPKGVFIENIPPAYTNLPNNLTYIHIPVLPNNSYVVVSFSIDKSIAGSPLIIHESYDTTKIPSRRLSNWSITINISRNISTLPNNTTVYVDVIKYLSNNPNYHGDTSWNFLNITNATANQGVVELWDAPYFSSGFKDALNWTGIILNKTQNASIKINIMGNNTYNGRTGVSMSYGFMKISFRFNKTLSNTSIVGIYASGYCGVTAIKEGPYKSASGEYNLWYERASVKNKATSYSFNITYLKIWAVDGSNPAAVSPYSNIIQGSEHVETPNNILNPRDEWSSQRYSFTYDGIPVVWANCTFKVVDSNITLLNGSKDDSFIVEEKILVVGSYLVKVTKHVIPNSDGTFKIYIVIENIGSEKTPNYIYVYDIVPKNMNADNFYVNASNMLAIHYNNDPTINFSGNKSLADGSTSYYWALYSLTGGANGDGWWDAEEIGNNQTVVISYIVNGSGNFNPTQTFIVGIDPTNSLLPATSPKVTTVSGAVENNIEPLLALITAIIGFGAMIRVRR